ncbi:MAG: putative DNA-binding domain-containing protein [Planctomycetes bacterium]|nr:putative DNA-binding domain-containing protein [Planctomycetota bacterium]
MTLRSKGARAGGATQTKPARLKDLQAWMQHEVVRVVERTPSKAPAARHVLPSKSLAPDERVRIYTTMYRLRMMEALEVDYPALLHHLGRERFEAVMLAYLRAHPSRHYSLNFLGYALPEFLARAAKVAQRGFLADVARIEHAITEVFDEAPSETLDRTALATLPPAAFAKARLEFVPAFCLLALDHDANKAVTALRHGQSAPSTKRTPAWVAVYRKDHVVWRMDLERPAFAILDALQHRKTLPQAIAAGAKAFDGDPEDLQAKLQAWFAEWATEGFFRALRR